jgi:6-phosphogluconolactonase (cycloisomerase 2 family)
MKIMPVLMPVVKQILIPALVGLGLSAPSLAADAFRIYAPSSKTKTLWIVDAVPKEDGGLDLKASEQLSLGFSGRVIAAHPEKPLLYIASGGSGERGKIPGAVVTLADDGSYGKHQRIELNDDAAYLSLDRSGAFLLGVSYGNGRLNVYRLDDDGVPGKALATVDEGKKEAHCVLVSPDNRHLYIPYVKGNLALLQYRFDASTGAVHPLAPLNANPPPGTGPRHLVYHSTLPMVYFTNEQGIGLSTYERLSDGQLTLRQDIDILPKDMAKAGLSASDLEITSDSKFIFAGLRASRDFDRIARYRIRDDGQAELLGLTPTDKTPWGLALSPDGRYLLVSAATGATLSAFRITPEGDLHKAASVAWDPEISDLVTRAIPAPAGRHLFKINSRSDLESIIADTADPALQQALLDHADAIMSAAERYPHVEAVIRTIERAPGTFTKINTTPDSLKKAAGRDIPFFDTLVQIDTRIVAGKAHEHRQENDDPYDAAFIEHLSHIPSLETVKLEATKIQDSWLAPLLELKNLKNLSVNGFGRLGDASLSRLGDLVHCPNLTQLELAYFGAATDAGWEQLAGLKDLEFFAPRGARFPGHCFAKFNGWTELKNINFHSNGLDDEGLGYVCENFPNLEFIKLWHSKLITDASAEHLKKLSKLKGIEISCSNATAALIKHFAQLPLEYVALEYGVDAPASDAIASVTSVPTLRRLKLANRPLTDPDLTLLAGATQIEELTIRIGELPDERLPQLQSFSFLKSLHLVTKKPLSQESRSKIRALLPNTKLHFE